MREYEQILSNIDTLTEFVKTKTIKINNITAEIENLKEKWLKPLEQLVNKINLNFSSYFSAMDCAGEVTLSHGEDIVSVFMRIQKLFCQSKWLNTFLDGL